MGPSNAEYSYLAKSINFPMYQLQYFVPDSYPPVNAAFDEEIMKVCAKLKGADLKGAPVPNSALSVHLEVMLNGANLEIKKREQPVYINLFCFETLHFQSVFTIVKGYYQ